MKRYFRKKKYLGVMGFVAVIGLIGLSLKIRPTTGHGDFASQASSVEVPKDLSLAIREFGILIADPKEFTPETCAEHLSQIYKTISNVNPDYFDYDSVKANYRQIIRDLFYTRLALRSKFGEFVNSKAIPVQQPEHPCVSGVRNVFRVARFLEDYLGETFSGVRPFDEKKDPVAIGTFKGQDPWLLKSSRFPKITFRSGDVIASRGGAFTSAAIAKIGEVDSQFSHIAVVYVKDDLSGREYTYDEVMKNPNVLILEAHIEVGSTIRHISKYLADGNSRNVLFRYSDATLAAKAAKSSYDLIIRNHEKLYAERDDSDRDLPKEHPNFNTPYNFKMDLENTQAIFCSQMASVGYQAQGLFMPLYLSKLSPASENQLVKALGITNIVTFAPGDLELDPRFELLAEWRDYRKMKAVRMKDAALIAMFDWMKKYNYQFYPTLGVTVGSKLAWKARHFDLPEVKIGSKVVFDITKKMPKNMSAEIAATITTLNTVGDHLLEYLDKEEAKYKSQNRGLLLGFKQMQDKLEEFRASDLKLFQSGISPKFHFIFRAAH